MTRLVTMVAISVFLLIGCRQETQTIHLHQEGHELIAESGDIRLVYLKDVIDYSYDQGTKQLFVLHGERSKNVDLEGYEAALADHLSVGGYVRVYELGPSMSHGLSMIYENDFTWVNPWSLNSGDFENDGVIELFLGCYRATDFYPADRRPFLVTWDGEAIMKKWTGSYIGMDGFVHGRIEDMNGDDHDELVLTVQSQEGLIEERVYRWGVFTFDLVDN